MSAQNPRPPRRHPRGPAGAAAAAASAAKSATTVKRYIWTGAFAAVTIMGTLYGAGLKTQQEYKEVRVGRALSLSPDGGYVLCC